MAAVHAEKDKRVLHDLKDLRKFRKKFKNKYVVPESETKKIEEIIQEVVAEPQITENNSEYVPDEETFKEETQRIVERDQKTILILNKALKHVREYDSKETALELMNKAYRLCPSMFVRREISKANQSLKAAIKAEKWQKSRKRKRHVDEYTVQKNLTTFYERIAELTAMILIEIERRTKKLFSRIKTDFASELPLTIPDSKAHTIRSAHIVAHCAHKPEGKFTHLERQLYLIEDATVIGINTNKLSKSEKAMDKAKAIALKRNAQLYPQLLLRPAHNVQWFLMLNFGTQISFASFADTLQIDDSDDVAEGTSYEDYLRQQEKQARVEERLKTQKLREYRMQFENDHQLLKRDYELLCIELVNLEDRKSKVSEQFSALTKLSETDNGLSVSHAGKLIVQMQRYKSNLMVLEGVSSRDAAEHATRQRIEARSYLYEYKDILANIRRLRQIIAMNREEWNHRRKQFAYRLGLVNPSSMSQPDLLADI